jgi:hypothetical protein
LLEKASQRLVQGGVIDQFAWPYYVSNPLPPSESALQPDELK